MGICHHLLYPVLSQGVEARTAVSSTRSKAPVLQLSSSEELHVVSIDAGDAELVEVVTCAVARLNIDWRAEKQDVHPKSKLDEHFLPPCQGLLFLMSV